MALPWKVEPMDIDAKIIFRLSNNLILHTQFEDATFDVDVYPTRFARPRSQYLVHKSKTESCPAMSLSLGKSCCHRRTCLSSGSIVITAPIRTAAPRDIENASNEAVRPFTVKFLPANSALNFSSFGWY
jgi:hypothetical protein